MDWVRFLDENNIHYVTRGPNTKRGEVSVHCPMCGPDDPSEHLGINPESGAWGCLRDNTHRGKSARTLVRAILGCSSTQASLIIQQYSHSDPDSLEGALAMLGEAQESPVEPKINPEREFAKFSAIKVRGATRRFFDYLGYRGYEDPHSMINYYDLKCAVIGRYKDRVIIPVRQNGELLGWTSRAIVDPKLAPRYLASSSDVKATVLNYDRLKAEGGKRLFIVEGPFDALKIDNYGRHMGVRATCTFGTDVTLSQIALLRILVKRFEQAYVLFDRGAEGPAANLSEWTKAVLGRLPDGIKDPGDLTNSRLHWMCQPGYDGGSSVLRWNPPFSTGRVARRYKP